MHTVPLDRSRLPSAARIAAITFSTAPHYAFSHPRKDEFPRRAHDHYLGRMLTTFASADTEIRIALGDDSDPWFADYEEKEEGAGSRVLGFATWTRHWGKGEAIYDAQGRRKWGEDSLGKKLERALRPLVSNYLALVNPDPTADPERMRCFHSAGPKIQRMVDDELARQPESKGWLWLEAIAVEPELQGKGIGGRLLRWGIERAEKEGLPILLLGTESARGLYERFGWEKVGDIRLDGTDVMLGDVFMCRWPKGVVMDAREAEDKGKEDEVGVSVMDVDVKTGDALFA